MPILFFHPCPTPTPEAIEHVRNKVRQRGSAWAWAYMTATGGIDHYPASIITMVERQEQRELDQPQELELEVAA